MPPKKNSAAGHVAAFAPLAIALLMNRSLLPGASESTLKDLENATEADAVKCEEVIDFQDCHSRYPTGCSKSGGYDPYLNLLKNQLIAPSDAAHAVKYLGSLDDATALDAKIPAEVSKTNHADFKDALAKAGEGQIYGVVGYLYYAKKTTAESSNCQLDSDDTEGTNVDFHIGIGFDEAIAQSIREKKPVAGSVKTQTSMIVEMTPHYRFNFNEAWTLKALSSAMGKKVRIVGQLILDSEHNVPSQNCAIATTAKQRQVCWRGSAWELHPVIQFQVCDTNACTANSTDWHELSEQ